MLANKSPRPDCKSSLPATGLPVVRELSPALRPHEVFRQLSHLPHALFLDSARPDAELARYSFVAVDPFEYWEVPAEGIPSDGSDRLGELEARLAMYQGESLSDLPPFQGGIAGLFSYDLASSLERVPVARFDEFQAPALAVGIYDVVIAFDLISEKAWIISQGFPETDPDARRERALARLFQMEHWLEEDRDPCSRPAIGESEEALAQDDLSPQHAVAAYDGLTSNLSETEYLAAVARAIEYIHAGDIFQVNLAHRLLHRAVDDPVDLYLRLRQRNPAPFAGYFDTGRFQIVSASPERLVRVVDRRVETRPIKGTRARILQPEADLFAGDELRASEKDRSENVMIVDLLRNDLSRTCLPESVRVTKLCQVESYQYVQHLVSVIEGELAPGRSNVDLIRALFPGGSITGAPKVRAMEIIAELEPTARGPYCGSLGYLGFDGSMDLSILIRTITAGRGWWQMPVGGGIVARSTPPLEYEETWQKAKGMLRAVKP